jgi:hypothetical protein
MKINPIELKQIIKEEATRLKRRMMLESEKAAILKQLQEMEECSLEEDMMDEGMFDKVGEFMGNRMDPAKAAAYFNQVYMSPKGRPTFDNIAKTLNITPEVLKAAIIKFIIENNGAPIVGGVKPNAVWVPATQSFKRQAGLGGPSSGTAAFAE